MDGDVCALAEPGRNGAYATQLEGNGALARELEGDGVCVRHTEGGGVCIRQACLRETGRDGACA